MSSYFTLANNTVYQNFGEAIILNLTNGLNAFGNTAHVNYNVEMCIDHATDRYIQQYQIYSTLIASYYLN